MEHIDALADKRISSVTTPRPRLSFLSDGNDVSSRGIAEVILRLEIIMVLIINFERVPLIIYFAGGV